jgi:hypothetical protein
MGLFARLRARHSCHGCNGCNGCHGCDGCCGYQPCCGYAAPSCHGDCGGAVIPMESAPVEAAPAPEAGGEAPAPPPAAALDRAPVAYRQVSFRR